MFSPEKNAKKEACMCAGESPCKDTEEDGICKARGAGLEEIIFTDTFDLGLMASTTIRRLILIPYDTSVWYLVMANLEN